MQFVSWIGNEDSRGIEPICTWKQSVSYSTITSTWIIFGASTGDSWRAQIWSHFLGTCRVMLLPWTKLSPCRRSPLFCHNFSRLLARTYSRGHHNRIEIVIWLRVTPVRINLAAGWSIVRRGQGCQILLASRSILPAEMDWKFEKCKRRFACGRTVVHFHDHLFSWN